MALAARFILKIMFKSLSNFNFRIIRKLILEKYLWEEIKVSDMGIVSAYVKPGPKVGQAKTSKFTLDIQKNTKEAVVKESSFGELWEAS